MDTTKQTFAAPLQSSHACDRINANRKPVPCPACHKGAVAYLLPETVIRNLPVKCKRCGVESVLNIPVVPVP